MNGTPTISTSLCATPMATRSASGKFYNLSLCRALSLGKRSVSGGTEQAGRQDGHKFMNDEDLIREQLAQVDPKLVASAWMAHVRSKRKSLGGRKPSLALCKRCGKMLSARQRRRKCPVH